MKSVRNRYGIALVFAAAVALANGHVHIFSQEKDASSGFEDRVREYAKQRESIEARLPAMPKAATAAQIESHEKALLKAVVAARNGAAKGVIFTPEAEKLIRSIVSAQYKGRDRVQLRKELAEAENASVPVKVGSVYPEAAELLEMPPTLLLALPQLPKQLRYRFVGTSLLLVDRENHLIVDYMTDALP